MLIVLAAVLGGLLFLLILGAIALASALTLIAAVSWVVRAPVRMRGEPRRSRHGNASGLLVAGRLKKVD